ncbi:hypothetical protein GEV43_03440 [Actinomadura sp. J1-007]|nr:hypothetical protein [Actinomadura sp. J1-007]
MRSRPCRGRRRHGRKARPARPAARSRTSRAPRRPTPRARGGARGPRHRSPRRPPMRRPRSTTTADRSRIAEFPSFQAVRSPYDRSWAGTFLPVKAPEPPVFAHRPGAAFVSSDTVLPLADRTPVYRGRRCLLALRKRHRDNRSPRTRSGRDDDLQ